jgi:sortase A
MDDLQNVTLARALTWVSKTLIAGGALVLGYLAFVVADARLFQERQARELQRLALIARASRGRSAPAEIISKVSASGLIGQMEIERLGFSAVIVEGADAATLRRGIGHIPGTSLPGQAGNVGIAGHRDTFFRPLRNIRPNDTIAITSLRGEFQYRVVSTSVVGPLDVSVLRPTDEESLTLVTCYPFYFVGSAPDRFIVRAKLIPPHP